ncbi:Autophagy protein 22 [Serendipita sp. 396]|nr:Autophagy protein 22 [Serendipita sp. 396]KAG8819300.1 Autophagy protein 22 [Serendipita sp. 401]KAG9052865.1 Autophagy protein 22 [Serendipita sp. 407]
MPLKKLGDEDSVQEALLPAAAAGSSSTPTWTANSADHGFQAAALSNGRPKGYYLPSAENEQDPASRYTGETQDALEATVRRLDSKLANKRLRGWYSYAFASEVFAVCSLTLFLPICLEQFARDNGYLLPDKTTRCVLSPDPDSSVVAFTPDETARCVVKFGWIWIDTASFSLYVYSFSVLLQAITVISMGTIADRPSHRKFLLLSFAFIGSTSAICFLFLPSTSPVWPLSALIAIVSIVSFGASIVALNAYLPSLARSTSEVRQKAANVERLREAGDVRRTSAAAAAAGIVGPDADADPSGSFGFDGVDNRRPRAEDEGEEVHGEEGDPMLIRALEDYNTVLSRATSRISSRGIALGYAAGILLLCIALIPVTVWNGSTFSLRLAVACSGIWWLLFSIPTALWLPSGSGLKEGLRWERSNLTASAIRRRSSRRRGGGDESNWERDGLLQDDDASEESEHDPTILQQIGEAWVRLGNMLRPAEMRRLRNTFWYLAAWFLLSDGFTTITSTAVLFAKTTLLLPPKSLIIVGLLTPAAGIAGSILWPRIQHGFHLSNKKVLVILILLASLVPAYGCLGFLPFFKGRAVGGLTTAGELYVLAAYFGSLYGAFQAYARAVFAELIPMGEEARWYGLFSITDKSSSFLGPLIVGLIADATGNIRYAFFFLVGMILTAVLPLLVVDVAQGRKDAEIYSNEG